MTKHDIERAVAGAVARDFAGHRLIVRLDQGLYRHLVFEAREHSWNDRFELITVPGSLTITGDRGSHTFRRMTDMFQFFRCNGNTYSINPSYWAEKLPDGGRSVQVYSEDLLRAQLKETLAEYEQDFPERHAKYVVAKEKYDSAKWNERWPMKGDGPREPQKVHNPEVIQERVAEYENDGWLMHEQGARDLLRDLESFGIVSDTWEWDLSDWDYHFLHNLHAIAWGISQYDRAVRLGMHTPRTGLVAWDTPLPCEPPAAPAERKAKPALIKAVVTLAPVGSLL